MDRDEIHCMNFEHLRDAHAALNSCGDMSTCVETCLLGRDFDELGIVNRLVLVLLTCVRSSARIHTRARTFDKRAAVRTSCISSSASCTFLA